MLTVPRNPGGWIRRHAWLAPITATCVLLGITSWINNVVDAQVAGWATGLVPSLNPDTSRLAPLGGLMWGSSVILFLAISAAAMVVLGTTTYRSVIDGPRRIPSRSTAVAMAGAVVVIALLVALSPLSAKPFAARAIVDQMLRDIGGTVDALWLVTLAAGTLVLAGACACLIEPRVTSPIAAEPSSGLDLPAKPAAVGQHLAAALNVQNRRLKTVLFAGAAVLVAGILELDSLYRWAASVAGITEPENAATLISAAAAVPTGTFFSLFLAAVYIPAALILRERGTALVRIALPGAGLPEQVRWLEENGLTTPVSSQITALVALLGPVLAGGPLNALAQVFG
jgi:hypothetical protein